MALQRAAIDTMVAFLGNTFYIPNYQREYSWEDSELEDFWFDLENTINDSDKSTHFFGQIVVHNDESDEKKYIIDGQQRTITSVIFLRSLQVIFEEIYRADPSIKDADYRRTDIESGHIGRQNELHLTLGQADNDYFKNSIQLGMPSEKKEPKKSCERIRKAYFFFDKRLRDVISAKSDNRDKYDVLDKYYKTFTKRFNVLYMEATKLEESFIIFETLNARGKELETADLLKNHIFSQTKGNIDVSQAKWNSMINKLEKTDPTKYIRHFWNSCQSFTRDKKLFKAISQNISNPRAAKDFLDDLEKYAQYYQDIVSPEDATAFTDSKLLDSLQALKVLKAKSFYPVILAMKQSKLNYSERDIRTVSQMIETYVFRNSTICGKVANSAEVFFARLANEIYNETLSSVDDITNKIKGEIVTDKEFMDAFEIYTATKSSKDTIRYIFRKIHNHLDKNNELNTNNMDVHIEHIMPVDSSNWTVSKDMHETYLWRLGNLTLLSGRLNTSISNKAFNDKKSVYANSKIEPNNAIASYQAWDITDIENRQRALSQYAVKIWSI